MKRQTILTFATGALLLGLILSLNVKAQTQGWGWNSNGQLGIGNQANQAFPQTVTSVPDATGISGGQAHTLFLKADGTVMAAGQNFSGELGTGATGSVQTIPVTVPGISNVIQVSGSFNTSAALKSDGTVWVWGSNGVGQVGNGTISSSVPTPTQSSISNVVRIANSGGHMMALKADGTVWAWGSNFFGEIGDGASGVGSDRSTPVQVGVGISGFNNIIDISAGASLSMALKSDGTVWIWGRNDLGQGGNGTNMPSVQPSPVKNTTLTNITQIAAGINHEIARRSDGTVWLWGDNGYGQMGNGTNTGSFLTPVQNTFVSNVVEISTNRSYHTLVRLRDGSIKSWGYNFEGETGNGVFTTTGCICEMTPQTTLAGTGNALVDSGYAHSFALKPSFTTPAGANVFNYGENITFRFANVASTGTTAYTAIDPTATGLNVPGGMTVEPNAPAYSITSSAATTGDIFVCMRADSEATEAQFNLLRILHEEGANLVDRTHYRSFQKRQICARVSSFSRFVTAKALAPTSAQVSIGGRVMTSDGQGIGKVSITLTGANGETRTALTNVFGYYRFEEVEVGRTYIVGVAAKRYSFSQPSQVVSVTEEAGDVNFVADDPSMLSNVPTGKDASF